MPNAATMPLSGRDDPLANQSRRRTCTDNSLRGRVRGCVPSPSRCVVRRSSVWIDLPDDCGPYAYLRSTGLVSVDGLGIAKQRRSLRGPIVCSAWRDVVSGGLDEDQNVVVKDVHLRVHIEGRKTLSQTHRAGPRCGRIAAGVLLQPAPAALLPGEPRHFTYAIHYRRKVFQFCINLGDEPVLALFCVSERCCVVGSGQVRGQNFI